MWLLAGPNGAGKSTFYTYQIQPRFPDLSFINADLIAQQLWPGEELQHGYQASEKAMEQREECLQRRTSFVTETVFSHPSKLELIERARGHGFVVLLVCVYVPVEVAVRRVNYRVRCGGHAVPEEKIRARHARALRHLAEAVKQADRVLVYDNGHHGRTHVSIAAVQDGVVRWKIEPRPAWAVELLSLLPQTQ
ncbi:zeta toxin family protein [Alkalilimnicola ehrlichii]